MATFEKFHLDKTNLKKSSSLTPSQSLYIIYSLHLRLQIHCRKQNDCKSLNMDIYTIIISYSYRVLFYYKFFNNNNINNNAEFQSKIDRFFLIITKCLSIFVVNISSRMKTIGVKILF